MCTAILDRPLFGRTLDLEHTYGEQVVITPRNYRFSFIYEGATHHHHAIVGVAHVANGTPLYYDAVNEAGLAAAALHLPDSTVYHPPRAGARNVASFELIPWLLGHCATIEEAKALLLETVVTPDAFSSALPATRLHWMVADANNAFTVESVAEGVLVHENPVGVLTNEPPFPYHMTHLRTFLPLSPLPPTNRLCPPVPISPISRGAGSMGLPGDFSSPSRFVRGVFAKHHTVHGTSIQDEVSRFFHVMDTVSQPSGCALTAEGKPVATVYTSCADLRNGAYYLTTYGCRRIGSVAMSQVPLDGTQLIVFDMPSAEDVRHLKEKG